jgi:hypothetical protein
MDSPTPESSSGKGGKLWPMALGTVLSLLALFGALSYWLEFKWPPEHGWQRAWGAWTAIALAALIVDIACILRSARFVRGFMVLMLAAVFVSAYALASWLSEYLAVVR